MCDPWASTMLGVQRLYTLAVLCTLHGANVAMAMGKIRLAVQVHSLDEDARLGKVTSSSNRSTCLPDTDYRPISP